MEMVRFPREPAVAQIGSIDHKQKRSRSEKSHSPFLRDSRNDLFALSKVDCNSNHL